MDRELVRLLEESRSSLENMKRLQTELVQREKLASLAQLVSGAAHEINNPLAAILGYSELLAAQADWIRSRPTWRARSASRRDGPGNWFPACSALPSNRPGEKTLLDMGSIVQRALQMKMLRTENKNIRLESRIAPDLPQIWGNVNQLFQCCVEIIGNAIDALDEVGGGTFSVSVLHEGDERQPEHRDPRQHDLERLPIVSLGLRHAPRHLHANFVVALLSDLFGIQARSGCFCAGPYIHRMYPIDDELVGAAWTPRLARPPRRQARVHAARASTTSSARRCSEYIVEAVHLLADDGWKLLPLYRFDPTTRPVAAPRRAPARRRSRTPASLASPARRSAPWPGSSRTARRIVRAVETAPAARARPTPSLSPEFERIRWFPLPGEAARAPGRRRRRLRRPPLIDGASRHG